MNANYVPANLWEADTGDVQESHRCLNVPRRFICPRYYHETQHGMSYQIHYSVTLDYSGMTFALYLLNVFHYGLIK